jgi:hypothetical protein
LREGVGGGGPRRSGAPSLCPLTQGEGETHRKPITSTPALQTHQRILTIASPCPHHR